VGRDDNGRRLLDHLESKDIQPVALELDSEAATGSYTAVLDERGELVIGLADMTIYDRLSVEHWQKHQAQLITWDTWCVDSNLSGPALEHLAMLPDSPRLYAVATSPAKAPRLGAVLTRLDALFLNIREAARLTGRDSAGLGGALQQAQRLRDQGLNQVLITVGAEGVAWADCDECGTVTAPHAATGNVSGAGDALAAAAIAMLEQNHSLRTAARWGLSAGIVSAQSDRLQTALSWATLEHIVELIDD
jgi:pseudouridine kinase